MRNYLCERKLKNVIIELKEMYGKRYSISTCLSIFTEQVQARKEIYLHKDSNNFKGLYRVFCECADFTTHVKFSEEEFLNFILELHVDAKAGATFGNREHILRFTKLALKFHEKERKEVEKENRKEIKKYIDLNRQIKEADKVIQDLYKQKRGIGFNCKAKYES